MCFKDGGVVGSVWWHNLMIYPAINILGSTNSNKQMQVNTTTTTNTKLLILPALCEGVCVSAYQPVLCLWCLLQECKITSCSLTLRVSQLCSELHFTLQKGRINQKYTQNAVYCSCPKWILLMDISSMFAKESSSYKTYSKLENLTYSIGINTKE